MRHHGRLCKKPLIDGTAAGDVLSWDGDSWEPVDITTLIITDIEIGTAAGQMLFWDGSEWVHTETSELDWNDTTKILVASGLTVTGSSVLGLNSSVFQPAAGGDSTTFFQIFNAAGGTPIFNADTSNGRIGIRTAEPLADLQVGITTTGVVMDSFIDTIDESHAISIRSDTAVNAFIDMRKSGNIHYNTADLTGTRDFTIYEGKDTPIAVLTIEGGDNVGNIGFNDPTPETLLELTHAQPYITLHNETHENTDGGRESRIIFKGEQGVDPFPETELAMLEVSHDGTGNDQLGKVVWSVNTGAGVVNRMKLDSTGMTIYSADGSDKIEIYHDDLRAWIKWNDGPLNLITDEGDNTDTEITIKGKGTGKGRIGFYDEDNDNYGQFFCSNGVGGLRVLGTSPVALDLQGPANIPIRCFSGATTGETAELQIWGFGDGFGGVEHLDMSVEQYAANTADFFGLENYMFEGNLITKDFTHSDADDAGATSWTAKRERSGTEEADIFSITGSHDGSGDDELGKVVVSVNTGAGLVEALRISSDLGAAFAGTINLLTIQGTATGNIAIGDTTTLDALDADPTDNIAIGNGAGSGITDGDDCIFIGYRAGYQHTTSGHCIAIGYEAGYSGNVIGGITAVGYQAAKYLGSGNGNTLIGYQAGKGDFGGATYVYNTFIGEMAGSRINEGGSNVCLGKNSGQHLFDGDRNIFLGFDAGHTQTDNSDLLIIDNRERANVAAEITDCLIYGVMAAAPADQTLRFNAQVGISIPPTAALTLPVGTATASTAPLKFTSGTDLTAPEAGVIEYDGSHFSVTEVIDRRVLSVASDSITTAVTVASTVSETTVFTAPISADELHVGKVLRIEGAGQASTHDAADTITVRIKIGTTVLTTLAMVPGQAADDCMHFYNIITIRTTGAGGTLASHGHIQIADSEIHENDEDVAVNTTIAENITVTFQWNDANAGNTATLDQCFLEVLV